MIVAINLQHYVRRAKRYKDAVAPALVLLFAGYIILKYL